MEYIQDQMTRLFNLPEYFQNQVAKFYEMFVEEEVYHDAVAHPIGFDEYFGPSPAPVDPRNWDLYWVSHPDGPLDEPNGKSTLQPGESPELEFPREVQPQGLPDVIARGDIGIPKSDRTMSIPQGDLDGGVDAPETSENQSEALSEARSIVADASARSSEVATETATEAGAIQLPQPPSFLDNLRSFINTRPALFKKQFSEMRERIRLPVVKLPIVKLPTVELPILKLPALPVPVQPDTSKATEPATPVKKGFEPIHYARTPLATYGRVKSRLQDRPPLVAAFADQVSVLNPAALVPNLTNSEELVPKGHLSTAWDNLLKNLGEWLPTPLAAFVDTKTPRKRSLASILGSRTAKKVIAEVEVIYLPFPCKLLGNKIPLLTGFHICPLFSEIRNTQFSHNRKFQSNVSDGL